MASYVIIRQDGAYVSDGRLSSSSYTTTLQRARRYASREAAERDLCPGNERIATVESQLSPVEL